MLGGEIIEPFRAWARTQTPYAGLALDNIVVVTLPQPMIVRMLLGGGIALGNLTIEVSRASGFYPDIVMGGAAVTYPELCAMVAVPGAEQFSSTIAMARTIDLCERPRPKPFRITFSVSLARSTRATGLQ